MRSWPNSAIYPTLNDKRGSLKPFINHRFNLVLAQIPATLAVHASWKPGKTLKARCTVVPGGEKMLAKADGPSRYFTVREKRRAKRFPTTTFSNGFMDRNYARVWQRRAASKSPKLLLKTCAHILRRSSVQT